MVCFNDYRAEFIVRTLAALQFLCKLANVAVVILSLVDAWTDRDKSSDERHLCQCVLHKNPLSCQLEETDDDSYVTLWDPLFISTCAWLGTLNLLLAFRDVTRGTSRILNALLLLITGSTFIGLGDHFDRSILSTLGVISVVFSPVLLVSVPICGRNKPFKSDEDSRLIDHDEFAHANGVFSELE